MGLFGGSKHKKPSIGKCMWDIKFGDTVYFTNKDVVDDGIISDGKLNYKSDGHLSFTGTGKVKEFCLDSIPFGAFHYFVDDAESPAWIISVNNVVGKEWSLIYIYAITRDTIDDAVDIVKRYKVVNMSYMNMCKAAKAGEAIELEGKDYGRWKNL